MAIQRKKHSFWITGIFVLVLVLLILIPIYLGLCKMLRQKPNHKVPRKPSVRNNNKIVDFRVHETQDFLINTPGCYIPNYAKSFKYNDSDTKSSRMRYTCGPRAVNIYLQRNSTIIFHVDKIRMQKYSIEPVQCCYKFVSQSKIPGHEHDQLSYTKCKKIHNSTRVKLDQEVITVICSDMSGFEVYKDVYIIIKKSAIKPKTNDTRKHWNVLMLGIDSMSRTRFFDTMPRTTKYIKRHKWLDYKGYHMVHPNTSKTLITILTGSNIYLDYSNFTSSLSDYANNFIWQEYKAAGYETAFGETNMRIPYTLSSGFKESPTDHFMRSLFLTGERTSDGILCTQKKPSTTKLLEYAYNFFSSYKHNKTFGMFWINSDTYTLNKIPSLLDIEIESLFKKLDYSGVLNNTFVIFFSDHGTTFGKMKLPVGSYYDYRLPMLFIWVPLQFRSEYIYKHFNSKENQERLITPYDLYITLADILKLSMNSNEETQLKACPQCKSLFDKKSPNTRCADTGIHENLCSCHNMTKLDTDDPMFENSMSYAVAHINEIWRSIKTIPCTSCRKLRFPSVIRSHLYHDGAKTYNIIAFKMSPNRLTFEAVIVYHEQGYEVLSVRPLFQYNNKGNCALNANDSPFCVCFVNYGCGSNITFIEQELPTNLEYWLQPFQLNRKNIEYITFSIP